MLLPVIIYGYTHITFNSVAAKKRKITIINVLAIIIIDFDEDSTLVR